ncbi:MAG: glycogen synthase GlgA [Pseudohongiellaceae bacterium]
MAGATSQILFVSSELYPLVKTGGLADVSYALPHALQLSGAAVTLMIPGYPSVLSHLPHAKIVHRFTDPVFSAGGSLLEARMPGSGERLLVFNSPQLYQRDGGIYVNEKQQDWPDNALRYGQFDRAVAEVAINRCGLTWQPDVVHCNDWQTGLVPGLIKHLAGEAGQSAPASVFTIHNLAYQGIFDRKAFDQLQLPARWWSIDGVEYYGRFSFLKAGLMFADKMTTVSPRYREEVLTPDLGCGMEGVLHSRRDQLEGILNGVDYANWNPETDRLIAHQYSSDTLDDKRINKIALQRETGLPIDSSIPIVGLISRLVSQKGIDLVIALLNRMNGRRVQWVILGNGDEEFEAELERLASMYSDKIYFNRSYDEGLAHQIEAGADIFLMPSRYEPCGLNQLYSLRYGTLPLVRCTGGLADTVVNATPETIADNSATGFVFNTLDVSELESTLNHALQLYTDQPVWRQISRRAMSRDFSWQRSADKYLNVYMGVGGE